MTALPGNQDPAFPNPPPTDATHVDGWITPDLEQVLQRAVDIANSGGYRQVHVQHLALAILEDAQSATRIGWRGALTATQWQQVLTDSLPARYIERNQPRQVTDIFCWRSSR